MPLKGSAQGTRELETLISGSTSRDLCLARAGGEGQQREQKVLELQCQGCHGQEGFAHLSTA